MSSLQAAIMEGGSRWGFMHHHGGSYEAHTAHATSCSAVLHSSSAPAGSLSNRLEERLSPNDSYLENALIPCRSTSDPRGIHLWHYSPLLGTDLNGVNHTFFSDDASFGSKGLRESSSRVGITADRTESLDCSSFAFNEIYLTDAVQTLRCFQNGGKIVPSHILCQLLERSIDENNLAAGRGVQSLIGNVIESDAYLGSCVIRMLTHFKEFHEANEVFSRIVEPDVFTWTAILSANVKLGDNERAIDLYREMLEVGVRPDGHVFVEVLKACMGTATLKHARELHANIIEYGLEDDEFVGSSLIGVYAKSGTLQDVRTTFCRLPNHNTVTWSTLFSGCIHHHSGNEVPELFEIMQQDGSQPDQGTFVCLLTAASETEDLKQGRQVHNYILLCGVQINSYVGNALVNMYGKCGCIGDAQVVFDNLFIRDVVAWSSLISGYAQNGYAQQVFELFDQMQEQGVQPNEVTHINILRAISFLEQGHSVHEWLVVHGSVLTVKVASALVDMYIRCGCISDAYIIFNNLSQRNVITWSTMIAGFFQYGLFDDAFNLLERMQDEGIQPNEINFLSFLKACSVQGNIEQGRQLHGEIIKTGLGAQVAVGNALLDMYVACQGVEDARVAFQVMPCRDVVSWTSILGIYAHYGTSGLEGFQVFQQMKRDGIEPNAVTYRYVLNWISTVAALEQGRHIHACIVESGIEFSELISNALLDVYAKCGRLNDAFLAFHRTHTKSVSTWSALLMGCAQQKDYCLALTVFDSMLFSGMKPDGVVFLCLLSACKFVGEGCEVIKAMRDYHGMLPTLEHMNSMVDILGHAGYLDEAEDLLETNPSGSNIVGWTSLLHSCKLHVNVAIAKRCFNNVIMMDPKESAAYVLMSSVFSHNGMLRSAEELEAVRRKQIGWKKPAHAFIEVNSEVHDFTVGDKLHPRSADIYAKLDALHVQMKQEGYAPRVDLVLGPMPTRKKEEVLCGHSEKLAIAFGLISLPHGSTIRVSKNLRMCGDCHNTSKLISKIEMRDILVNDTYRMHHFQEGVCSCNDYSYQNFKDDVLQVK